MAQRLVQVSSSEVFIFMCAMLESWHVWSRQLHCDVGRQPRPLMYRTRTSAMACRCIAMQRQAANLPAADMDMVPTACSIRR